MSIELIMPRVGKDFELRGFAEQGAYHWGYDKDFCIVSRNKLWSQPDIYNGETLGFGMDGKEVCWSEGRPQLQGRTQPLY
jgi:hypothetical protein